MSQRHRVGDSTRFVNLEEDVLLHVCLLLDAIALSSLACTCRKLRSTAESPAVWQRLATRRWYKPNEHMLQKVATDENIHSSATRGWKRLYVSANGWHGGEDGGGPPQTVCKKLWSPEYNSPATILPLKPDSTSDGDLPQSLLLVEESYLIQIALPGQSGPQELSAQQCQRRHSPDCTGSPALASVSAGTVAVAHAQHLEVQQVATGHQPGRVKWQTRLGHRYTLPLCHLCSYGRPMLWVSAPTCQQYA